MFSSIGVLVGLSVIFCFTKSVTFYLKTRGEMKTKKRKESGIVTLFSPK